MAKSRASCQANSRIHRRRRGRPFPDNLLKIAKVEVAAVVPFREDFPKRMTPYSRHAQHLVAGLLERIPADQLTRPTRIARLESEVGL
ncbi:hypothetical protein METHPM2_110093 [Pseudomonas sp. PM2]